MRVVIGAISLIVSVLIGVAGCANSPYALQQQAQTLQQQQVAMQQRNQELQARANTLDRDNQELESLLAQTRQQSKVVEDQVAALRDQLASTTAQLGQLREDKQVVDRHAEALMASTRRRTGATITANNSLQRNLPPLNLPGIETRVDGDVVRIELPAARLFVNGSTSLQPVAGSLIDTVAIELSRAFPNQKIGVEGHTDIDPIRYGQGGDNQQFSTARATAVYQYLVTRGQIPASQLFIVGHGGSQPVVSNATAAGKARNNRIELVVYPDKAAGAP